MGFYISALKRSRPTPPDVGGYHDPQEVSRRSQQAYRAAVTRNANRQARGIDPGPHPATADVDYEKDEVEFIFAVHKYQNDTGHKFPTYSEILRVLKSLGYERARTAPGPRFHYLSPVRPR